MVGNKASGRSLYLWVGGAILSCAILTYAIFAALMSMHTGAGRSIANTLNEPGSGDNRFSYTIQSDLIRSLTPELLVIPVLIFLCVRITSVLAKNPSERIRRQGFASESGTSVVQFILVFPILLILLLVILQIALIVQAKFVVNYAAFNAVRSAIVTIPARVASREITENRNVIHVDNPESPKIKIIQRAAALPCVGISPRFSPGLVLRTGTSTDPSALIPLLNLALFVADGSYLEQVLARAPYAYDRGNTKVQVLSGGGGFTDHSSVTVTVTHRYYLTVPFADRLFGTDYHGGSWFGFNAARYAEIKERYTLFNEGEPFYPESQKDRFGDSNVEVENY